MPACSPIPRTIAYTYPSIPSTGWSTSVSIHSVMLGRRIYELWNLVAERFSKKLSGSKGACPIWSSWKVFSCLMKLTLQSLPLLLPCSGSQKEWLVGLKEFGRYVHGLVLEGETEFISWEKRHLALILPRHLQPSKLSHGKFIQKAC